MVAQLSQTLTNLLPPLFWSWMLCMHQRSSAKRKKRGTRRRWWPLGETGQGSLLHLATFRVDRHYWIWFLTAGSV